MKIYGFLYIYLTNTRFYYIGFVSDIGNNIECFLKSENLYYYDCACCCFSYI
jgi:hypothetical protein